MRSTIAIMAAAAFIAAPVAAQPAGGRPFTTSLDGASEVPGPGDPDGTGSATVRINTGLGQLCYDLTVSGIAPATAAHVHEAPAGSPGPVVVTLKAPTSGSSSGCVLIGRQLAREIAQAPSDYYVNVHNSEFTAGALRGQLDQ